MALKLNIDKASFESLPADVKKEYIAGDGDKYTLDIDGIEDTGALKRGLERERSKAKSLLEKLNGVEGELDTFKNGDIAKQVAATETKWQDKYNKDMALKDASLEKLTSYAKASLADTVAANLAKEVSSSPDLLLPHIKSRIIADLEGDSPTTKILDKDGKVGKMTLDDLKKEVLEDKRFSAIIVASRSKGGGGAKPEIPTKQNSGGTGSVNNEKLLHQMSPKELVANLKSRNLIQS
jgi:hypothetical protein